MWKRGGVFKWEAAEEGEKGEKSMEKKGLVIIRLGSKRKEAKVSFVEERFSGGR